MQSSFFISELIMKTFLKSKIYKWTMAILAVIEIALIITDFAAIIDINIKTSRWFWLNNTILVIFAIDYFYRLYLAEDKKKFIKTHIYDLLAIIPVGAATNWMQLAKMGDIALYFRLLRLIRLAGLMGKLHEIIHTNGILYMLYFSIAFLMLGSVAISITEHVSLDQAFWWAITTASTVGYGDISTDTISPKSLIGKLVILAMILIGVGVVGMVTSSITTYFMKKNSMITASENKTNLNLIIEKRDSVTKQNEQLLEKTKRLEEQIQELQAAQNQTEWHKFKEWLDKKESKNKSEE